MWLNKAVGLEIVTLLILLALAGAVGRVPDGAFSSERFEYENLNEPQELCERTVSCAGITYHPHEQDWAVYFHSFLPPLLNNANEHDWITQRSDKSFVFHPGKLDSKQVLKLNVDPSTLSLSEAESICKNHGDCVAFSYPVNATGLDGLADIIFASSVDNISTTTTGDNWHTLVVNEESKAEKANADTMVYIEELEDRPYNTCCKRVTSLEEVNLPSIEEVERMDKLPRISCSISKEDFQAQYEFTRTPVILVGCDKDWPAKTEWTFEKLTKRFGNDNTTTWRTKKIDMPGEWDEELTWNEVAELRGQNNGVYIFDPLDSPGKDSIEDDYLTPAPIMDTDMFALDFPPNWGSRHWLCLGERFSGSDIHNDPFATDAWNSLISGHKWWVLYPQQVEESMVKCDTACSPEEPEALDWFTSIGINAARTSFAGGVMPIHLLQKPGETLYVPNQYLHSVMNLDETISITANFGSPGNLQKVWEAAVRKGAIHHWVDMYEQTFTDEEREAVMEGEIWPPYLFAGIDPEAEDFVYNYVEGMYDEAETLYDNDQENYENEENNGDQGSDEL